MVTPIKPSEVAAKKQTILPPEVIEAWNCLIAQKYSGGVARIEQKEIITAIKKVMNLNDAKRIFTEDWLEIEDIYREAGWKVEYDRPGYDEDYEPTFTFSKR